MKINNKILLPVSGFVLVVLLLVGWFYWFQWRPASIRSECYKFATDYELSGKDMSFEKNQRLQAIIVNQYSNCLHKHGIEN